MPGGGKPFGALESLESVMREIATAGESGYLTQSEGLVVIFNNLWEVLQRIRLTRPAADE